MGHSVILNNGLPEKLRRPLILRMPRLQSRSLRRRIDLDFSHALPKDVKRSQPSDET